MDVFLSIIVFIFVASIWIRAGLDARNSSGVEKVWAPAKTNQKVVSQNQRLANRQFAIQKAKPFLKKFSDPMGEQCLANENCKVNLILEGENRKIIICISKKPSQNGKMRLLTATVNMQMLEVYNYTSDYIMDNFWDTLCLNFSETTVYENIYDAANAALLNIQESELNIQKGNKTQKVYDSVSNTQIRTNNLLNINTATEAEFLALPGVNIVLAKKAIKYIEKTGGFKSVDEFIEILKIKEIFANQIKNLACVNFEENEGNENNLTFEKNTEPIDISETNEQNYTPHSDNERIIDL